MAAAKPVAQVAALPTKAQWTDWVKSQVALNPQFIPPNQLCVEDLLDWEESADQLSRIKAREAILRRKIFDFMFPVPVEGVNNVKLPDGTLIKGGYKIDRKVDEALLQAMNQPNPELDGKSIFEVGGINSGKLVKMEPSLVTSEYRELTEEQRLLFERVLIMKPSMPSLDLVPPKAGT